MRRFSKGFVNFAFLLLMSAVVLRPVVVQAGSNPRLNGASPAKLSAFSKQDGSGLPPAALVSKADKLSNLHVIPKEMVSFDGVAPRFAQFSFPLPTQYESNAAHPWDGLSSLKPLVLRI